MKAEIVDQVARAVLYVGYVLYPYRRTVPPNRRRVTVEAVKPTGAGREGGRSQIEAECVVRAPGTSSVDVHVRFRHLVARRQAEISRAEISSDDAIERVVTVPVTLADGCCRPVRESFRWPGLRTADLALESLRGDVEVFVEPAVADQALFKLLVRVANTTTMPSTGLDRASVRRHSFVSTHVLVEAPRGRFVSLIDPSRGVEAKPLDLIMRRTDRGPLSSVYQ